MKLLKDYMRVQSGGDTNDFEGAAFRVEEFSDLFVEPSSAKCFISDETDKIEFISPFRQPDDIRKSEYIRCTEVER